MKVTLICEGSIDQALVYPLISRIAESVGIKWPLNFSSDEFNLSLIRKSGHGGVLEKVRRVVDRIKRYEFLRPDILVIVLDHKKTSKVVDEIKRLIRGVDWIVLGIAIEEIEAWWLADQKQTLAWLQMSVEEASNLGYGHDYAPESDIDPKRTLDILTSKSDAIEARYGRGLTPLAEHFASVAWENWADLDSMRVKCAKGFAPFQRQLGQQFPT
jgi:hypothetical protein